MIDKNEILERVGVINPPREAHISNRINTQMVIPQHLTKAIEEMIRKKNIQGEQQLAQYIIISLFLTSFFMDCGDNEQIFDTLVSTFKFSEIEPKIGEVADP